MIGSETLSKAVDWSDRSTAVLFGDGAGGVLLETSEQSISWLRVSIAMEVAVSV